jgi:repressor LexA
MYVTVHLSWVSVFGMKLLTEKQQSVLDFVVNYRREHGYTPSIRDICTGFGFSGPMAAMNHLKALEKKGFIRRSQAAARGIQVLREERGLLFCGKVS